MKKEKITPQWIFGRIVGFMTREIWTLELSAFSRITRWLIGLLKVCYLVIRGFLRKRCALRASALTYATLLAVVPLLAFSFALARAFGLDLNPLKIFIIENLTLGNEEVGTRIFEFVENIRAGTLGPPALALLVVTVISVMGNIELSFNYIWGIKKPRTILRKFTDYLSVILVVPLLIAAGVAVGGVLRSHGMVETVLQFHFLQNLFWRAADRFLVCAGFVFLYLFMPNKRVRFLPALLGGLIAGILWQAALWGYVSFQVGFVRHAAIYGALASIPINLVWLYISWNIVLFGAQVSFVLHNYRTLPWEEEVLEQSWEFRELVAVNLLVRIARRFRDGGGAPSAEELAEELEVSIRLVNQVLDGMVKAGIVSEVAGDGARYQPARDLERLTLKEAIDGLRRSGGPEKFPPGLRESVPVRRIEEIVDRSLAEHGGSLSLRELLDTQE